MKNAQNNNPAPIYHRIRDLFKHGFKIDWVTASFISISHVICLVATPIAYFYAPEGFWKVMLGWTLIHALIGCLSTTVYSHRLIAHGAAKTISWPVHIVFGFIGQAMAIQGSVRRWAAMHVIHHGVDRSGKHHLDPYSATWFTSGWRNFLWSHMLTYFFHHPDTAATEKAFQAKNSTPLVWQDKLYLPLLVGLNFLLPLALGAFITESVAGGFCLMVASIGGFILAQHNTWTVNSVTHMWGFTKGAFSSAKNNYIWMGPLGEGNHHADHHDYGRDYRNGFGWSGWLLDPTRYVILLLNALGLVKGLRRASKRQEAEIIARRELLNAQVKTQPSRFESWEKKLETLKLEWLEATQRWEAFKTQKVQLKSMSLPKFELQQKLDQLKAEMEVARRAMRARKQAFFDAIYEVRAMQYAPV
jgi:stearoyl-CoA desaturase (Delta-9 desaturase)